MKRAMRDNLTRRSMTMMAKCSEVEIPEGNSIWQLKNKL
jgi:hypothetical protein